MELNTKSAMKAKAEEIVHFFKVYAVDIRQMSFNSIILSYSTPLAIFLSKDSNSQIYDALKKQTTKLIKNTRFHLVEYCDFIRAIRGI